MLTAGQRDPCMYSSPTTEKASLWLAVFGHVEDPGCISTLPNHIEGTSLKVSMTSEILPWIRRIYGRWSYIQSYFPTSRSTHALGHKSLPWLVVIDWNVYTLISRLNIYNTTLCATGIPPPRYFRTMAHTCCLNTNPTFLSVHQYQFDRRESVIFGIVFLNDMSFYGLGSYWIVHGAPIQ